MALGSTPALQRKNRFHPSAKATRLAIVLHFFSSVKVPHDVTVSFILVDLVPWPGYSMNSHCIKSSRAPSHRSHEFI